MLILSSDVEVLPEGLLSLIASHCRVDFDRDHSYLKLATARAIAEIENQTNRAIVPTEYLWKPVCEGAFVQSPIYPIRGLSYQTDPDVWVSLPWQNELTCDRFHCDWLLTSLSQSTADGLKLDVGYEGHEDIPMDVLSAILLLTAALYENRESMQFGTIHHLPDQVTRLMAGLWRPSV
jgi:hypothetical protein